MTRYTVIIAEYSCLIRNGLRSILEKLENVDVIQSIQQKEDVCEIVDQLKPDILIVNPNMLPDEYIDVEKSFFQTKNISIILISEDSNVKDKYQADEYIDFQDNQNIIFDKVQHIIHQKIELIPSKHKSNETLSAREKNILKHVALGLTNKEIADQLFISIHTVVTHRKNITQKLGIKSVSGLTVYAILNNLISMDEVK